jgi:very-short-patch-repair endonuclease
MAMHQYARGLTCSKSIDPALARAALLMRLNPTPSEAVAWEIVRHSRLLGLKFRRQQIIERFIVDLYCHRLRLCVEIDGDAHDSVEHRESDEVRDERLEVLGFRVARIRAEAVDREGLDRLIRPFIGVR